MLQRRRPKNLLLQKKRTFIDPFDDPHVQAGQGTVAYEILEEARKESIAFDAVLVPVGGGGPHFRCFYLYQRNGASELKSLG